MSSYGSFYSTKTHSIRKTVPQHPPISDPSNKCPMSFAHGSDIDGHEFRAPQKSDIRSVCPALNTMANHGYIPRDGRNLTFFIIFNGLQACYGLSTPLAFVLTLGGFLLIRRFPITLPFNVPKLFEIRNPDGSRSQPGVIDLRLVSLHGGTEHDASLVHADCPRGAKYPSPTVHQEMVGQLIGDVLPKVNRPMSCLSHIKDLKEEVVDGSFPNTSIISRMTDLHRRQASASSSSATAVSDDEGEHEYDEGWRQYATEQYLHTLVSAADVGRMRVRREQEIYPKELDNFHAEIARGEMAIILGVWERTVEIEEDDKVKKGIPLPYLLTWLAEERLPEGWKPDHVEGLWDVAQRSKAIKAVAKAIVIARSY